ncbi:MAG: ABC transporter ATP-binding protein [Actinobacteria bacterium]|nr:MAG: ABC transporter ATP-binding protein [Actinomycetota bacterium]
MTNEPLLGVRRLATSFETPRGTAKVLDGLDLDIERGEILGLVGESGSGKSVTAYSIARIVRPPGRVVGGEVRLEGRDLLALSEREMRAVRGKEISMIFQDPRGYLDPVARVGSVLREIYRTHEGGSRAEAKERALEMLRAVGLPAPELVYRAYPHELSGGMAQRAMIALALACSPKLLIADEPTTALDVTIQIQIVRLLASLRERFGLTILLITHNLSVVAEVCDRVAVMYAGEIVETAPAHEIFVRPRHPYTVGLLGARPRISSVEERLSDIRGRVPDLLDLPAGCRFNPRCFMADDRCRREEPSLRKVAAAHESRCHYAEQLGEDAA